MQRANPAFQSPSSLAPADGPGDPSAPDRIADAAYRADLDDETWLRDVLDACAAVLDDGGRNGLAAVFVDARGVAHSATRAAADNGRCGQAREWLEHSDARELLASLGGAGVLEAPPSPRAGAAPPSGIAELRYAVAGERTGPALFVVSPRSEPGHLSGRQAAHWSRAAACITAGLHLRQHLASPRVHTGDADVPPASSRPRASLRVALQASETGAGSAPLDRRSPEQARSLWSAVVAGQWALIDRFDADGKRYLVARRSASAAVARSPLSAREYQVAAMVAAGQSNKVISYELGLAASTVATHLSSAMTKLGVTSRVELVQLFGPGS